MSFIAQGAFQVGGKTEFHVIASDGQNEVTISPRMSKVYGAVVGWHEEPDNPTFGVYVTSTSDSAVKFKATHATTKEVFVVIFGRN